MNYLAHAYRFLDRPYFVAGTAIPDWLNVVDRKVRARARAAREFVHDPDTVTADVARGIVQHHFDDDQFHRQSAFAELSWAFTRQIRDRLPGDTSLRPSFLGHITVELLLDAALIQADRSRVDNYYRVLQHVCAHTVETALNRMATRPTRGLAPMIQRFLTARFLYDYCEDGKLLMRLNGVLQRTGLPALPESFQEWFPAARAQVGQRQHELLNLESGVDWDQAQVRIPRR